MNATTENNIRVAKNTLFLYIRMFLIMGVTLYTSRVILNALGVEDYGISNVVGGVVSMVSFLSTAVANGFQRYYNYALGLNDKEKFKSYFSTSIIIEILLCFICIVLAETVGLWFVNTKMTIPAERLVAANWVYQCSIITFLIALMRAPYNAIIIAYERMDTYAYISIIEAVGKLGVAFLVSYSLFDKLKTYSLWGLALSLVIFLCYVFFAQKYNGHIKASLKIKKDELKEMVSFSGWNLFGSLAHMLKGNGLNIVLNLFFMPSVNAARGVAYQVSSAINAFSSNIVTASRPQVIKYYAQNEYDAMSNLTNKVSKYSFCLLWLISLPIICNIDFIMKLWLGEALPDLAPYFCIIVLLTTLVESFGAPIATLVHASGKMKVFQIVVSSVILMIVPIAYFVLKFGAPPQAAFYVSLIVVTVAHIVRLIIVRRIVPFSVRNYLGQVIVPCALVVVISLIVPFVFKVAKIQVPDVVYLLISILSVAIAILFIGLSKSERTFFFNKTASFLQQVWKRR